MGLTCLEKSNIKNVLYLYIQVQMEIAHFFSFVFLVKEHAFKLYIYTADFKDFSWNLC